MDPDPLKPLGEQVPQKATWPVIVMSIAATIGCAMLFAHLSRTYDPKGGRR